MAMDGLPEGVASPGRVPEQLLQAAPILKRRRRRYRGEMAKEVSVLGVSTPRAKYRRRGAPGGPTSQPGGLLAVALLRSFGDSGSFCCGDSLYIFFRNFWSFFT